ncbi:MAG: MaoC family dehydratase [Deltaproteobacteria bacterium]|nr:MaoC family dehydratase [Deltaproteobacteria bacterium]
MQDAINELKGKVGAEINLGDWMTMEQELIDTFSEASRDLQWIHVDPERAAKESPFGATVAQGYLTLSMTTYLTGTLDPATNPFPDAKVVINYGLNKVRFPAPVKAGSRIRARTTLVAVEEIKGGVQVIKKVAVEIEGVDKPGCVAETVTRFYF